MEGPAQPTVRALIGDDSDQLGAAVAGQDRPPSSVVRHRGPLRAGVERAAANGADWIWVLDGSAEPRSSALAALTAALERAAGLPPPALLAGAVRGPAGRISPGQAAWYRRGDPEPAMAAAERRLLPIRAAAGPVLVRGDAAVAAARGIGRPLSPGAVLELSARVLRSHAGYLVPESESVAAAGAGDPLLEPITAARMVAGRAFTGSDRLRVALEVIERAAAATRR